MNSQTLIITTAYLLDLIIGDPQWNWHPVRLIGRFIGGLERRLNAGDINKNFSGTMLLVFVVSITVFSVLGILKLAAFIHPTRSEEHTSELQSQSNLVCRLLLEKK